MKEKNKSLHSNSQNWYILVDVSMQLLGRFDIIPNIRLSIFGARVMSPNPSRVGHILLTHESQLMTYTL